MPETKLRHFIPFLGFKYYWNDHESDPNEYPLEGSAYYQKVRITQFAMSFLIGYNATSIIYAIDKII